MSNLFIIGYCEICDEQVCVPLENVKLNRESKYKGIWICPGCKNPWPIEPKNASD